MKKTYQPDIIKITDEMIELLESIDFFTDFELDNTEPCREILLDIFTEKFISGTLENLIFRRKSG